MRPCGFRVALLARGIDGGSIFFPVAVTVTEEESAVFAATISGMDERVFAMGKDEEEAAFQAVAMFMDIVDAAIKRKLPLKPILGETQFRRSDLSLDQAKEIIRSIREVMEGDSQKTQNLEDREHAEWSKARVMPGFLPFINSQLAAAS